MSQLLVFWVVLFLAIGALVWRARSGALVLAYFLGASLIHVPGALVFLGEASGIPGRIETQAGFQLTMAGLTAFGVGALASWAFTSASLRRLPTAQFQLLPQSIEWRMVGIGAFAYFVLLPISGSVPSLTSLVSGVASLLLLGLWVRLYRGEKTGEPFRTYTTLAFLPALPVATLAFGGFIGFGVNWVLSVLTFFYAIARNRFWFVLGTPVAIFLGLSLFVAYMGERTGIRDVVWHQRAGISDRIDRISDVFTALRPFDMNDQVHATAISNRLNQNYLVGVAAIRHRTGATPLARGATIQPWALIPRAFWPNKPTVGGGRQVVMEFTGIRFAEGTSVGAGQVLEFYMNFGVVGLLGGFAGLGVLLMTLDTVVQRALERGDLRRLMLCGMPGLTLLQPGGNLLEILVACVAATAAAYLLTLTPPFRAAEPVPGGRGRVAPGRQLPVRSYRSKAN